MSNYTRRVPPAPSAESMAWQLRGLCTETGDQDFFNQEGERGTAKARRQAAAKRICRACPVRWECALWSLQTRQPYGTLGGYTEEERGAALEHMERLPTGVVDVAHAIEGALAKARRMAADERAAARAKAALSATATAQAGMLAVQPESVGGAEVPGRVTDELSVVTATGPLLLAEASVAA